LKDRNNVAQDAPLKAVIIPVTQFQQNCSLVWCATSKQAAFVDAGGDIELLLEAVAKHGVTLTKLLVTHGHLDHCGATAELAERFGLPIEGPHKEDAFWIDQLETQAGMFGFPPSKGFTPNRWLEDGDTVTLGDLSFDVRHCPGHTPGHVIFFHNGTRLAFVGDVLFQGSIGRTDFPRGDHATLINAITTKLWPLGDDVTFVPGHGALSTFGRERQTNPYVADRVLARG
jgi:hydroxyacylglutathione hydrolase